MQASTEKLLAEVARLTQERSKLLASGAYTMEDALILQLTARIEQLQSNAVGGHQSVHAAAAADPSSAQALPHMALMQAVA